MDKGPHRTPARRGREVPLFCTPRLSLLLNTYLPSDMDQLASGCSAPGIVPVHNVFFVNIC